MRDVIVAEMSYNMYTIDPTDGGDRIYAARRRQTCLSMKSSKYLVTEYQERCRRSCFFVDNRNVIGKDVPFQFA